ncbi:MAG: AlpA family phage regulatory protein [Candidatus Marinimicrobia bacterium]|nr:AlpA family phage regulatory protein [Candidatus Neomarinimicrobiota bacterium]
MQSQLNLYQSDKQVANRFEVSRATVWRWVKEGLFPKPVKLSAGCTRWKLSDIEQWEAAK